MECKKAIVDSAKYEQLVRHDALLDLIASAECEGYSPEVVTVVKAVRKVLAR